MALYTLNFYNLGYSKHFDTLAEAIKYGKESGFECSVIDPDGEWVKTIKVIQQDNC